MEMVFSHTPTLIEEIEEEMKGSESFKRIDLFCLFLVVELATKLFILLFSPL